METGSAGHIKTDEGSQESTGDAPDSQQPMQQMTMSPQSSGGPVSSQSQQQASITMVQPDAQPSTTTTNISQHGGQHQQQYQHEGSGQHQGNRNSHSYHNTQNPSSNLHTQQQHRHPNKYNNPNRNDSEFVNHILLVTVINAHYHFNCLLVHQIFSNYGKVQRIVIFRKNGVQAMVEFEGVESAKRAKAALNGYELFNNCCTLRIEYAKTAKLNVHRNDNDSYDYTNPSLPSSGPNISQFAQTGDPNIHMNLSGRPIHSRQPGHHQHGRAGRGPGVDRSQSRDNLQQQGSPHFHQSNPNSLQTGGQAHHHHVQAGISGQHSSAHPQHGSSGAGGYGLVGSPVDHGGDTGGSFPQEGKYGMNRQAPSQYVDPVDGSPYIQPHGGPHHHHHDANLYNRQYGHQQNPHHQGRSGARGDSYGPDGGGNAGHSHGYPSAHNTSGSNTSVLAVSGMSSSHGTVMMVYGLQLERVSCDRLFNLFCLYGNVARVKFLRTKEGCAMVQMGDVLAVNRCVSSLNKSILFGSEVQISYSKQAFLHDVMQPFILPDGSLSFKDFMGNKNNRFKNPEVASKNRISPPSPVLHFFNAPYGISEEEIVHLFKQNSGHEPVSVNIFPPKENSKSYSGLINFKDSIEATESLVICNHITMPKPGAPHPYVLRLCFSQAGQPRSQHNPNQAQQLQQATQQQQPQ